MTDSLQPRRRRRPEPRTVLAVASLGAAVAFVDATIVNIAFPNIARSFPGTSISSLSWVLNAYNIVFAAFLVPAGRIADLVGRRRTFVLGLEIFTAASLLCAGAPSPNALIGFRVVQALGAALLVPSALALVLHAFPQERRTHGVALLSAVAAAAAGLGPSLGGLLVAADDWRLVFLVNIPIGLAAIVMARRLLTESRAPGRRRLPDLLGATLMALAIAALVLGVVKGPDWGWGSAGVIASFVVAIVLGALVVWRCTWHRSPVIDLSLLRIRTFSVANSMTILAAAGFYGYTLTNVLFLTGVWRYSVLQAGLALTPGPFVAAAVAVPTSKLVLRIGHRPVLVAGGLIWGAAVLWFVKRVGTTPEFLSQWLPGMIFLGIGAGTLLPNISSAAVASAPGQSFATATGMNSVARQVGAALGVALVVAIIGNPSPLQAVAAFRHAWTFGSICLFAAGLGCLLVGRVALDRAPSLAEAARLVLTGAGEQPASPPRPRARRASLVNSGSAVAVRIESDQEFLARVPLFAALEPPLLASLAGRASSRRVGSGEWLFHEGEPGDSMYVVKAGRLEVVDEQTGAVIRELGRGDWLGELALITASPRSASVRAARTSDLLVIERPEFEDLLGASLPLSMALNQVLAEQLREARGSAPTARPRPTTVALVALTPDVAVAEIAARITTLVERHLTSALLVGTEAPAPGAGDSPASVYGPLLDRAEAGHDIVMLCGGRLDASDAWTEFCLQQADRILALTSGGPVPEAVRGRPELRRCDLVALDVAPGSGALSGWGAALDPIETHALRAAELEDDCARIARRLTGRAPSIVLSGGGSRAFSHIGVLEELTASGVRIDRIAGVSMGAFIGALFAMGWDADEVDACCFDEWVQRRPLGDYTFPRHSLLRGARVESMLHRTFGEVAIEELACSFMCGCTELRSGSLVLARWGQLWEQVGLSINIPILAAPQVRGRQLLVDGSLVDNLPAGAIADLGEGPLIAVDVKATFDRTEARRVQTGAAATNGRPPSLGETLTRVLLLGSANTSEAAARHADLVIKPRAEGVGLLEFHQIDAAREAGRAAARQALEQAPPELFAM
jgi:NTE family protein